MPTANDSPAHCVACGAELHLPVVCDACGQLQPILPERDYFRLFGLPRSFRIDEAVLKNRFIDMTRRIHPDRYSLAPDSIREQATRIAAEVNEAMAILKHPIARAEYLLHLHAGRNLEEERRVPQQVLAEILMLREEIEEVKLAGDHETIAVMTGELQTRLEQAKGEMSRMADEMDFSDNLSRGRLREIINTAKYYEKTLDELTRI